ncbi:MAG: GFA family protein [Kiloniellales bacterium]|nr:GFA family protein [Kiloniellales bacterium]
MEQSTHQGGCLCGQTRYRISAEPVARALCHCRECRLASGAASVAWFVMPVDGFEYVSGTPALFESSPSVTRGFCPHCGTTLTYQHTSSAKTIDVTTATLDDPEAYAPVRDVWVEEKLGWEPLDPSRPHFARFSAGAEPINAKEA